jgi:hypothetical protein
MSLKNKEIELVNEVKLDQMISGEYKEEFDLLSSKLLQYQMVLRDMEMVHSKLNDKVREFKMAIPHGKEKYNYKEVELRIRELKSQLDLNIQKFIGIIKFAINSSGIEITEDTDIFSLDLSFIEEYTTQTQFKALCTNQEKIRKVKNLIDNLEYIKEKLTKKWFDFRSSVEIELDDGTIRRGYTSSIRAIKKQKERVRDLESRLDQSAVMMLSEMGIKGITLTDKLQNLQLVQRAKELETKNEV